MAFTEKQIRDALEKLSEDERATIRKALGTPPDSDIMETLTKMQGEIKALSEKVGVSPPDKKKAPSFWDVLLGPQEG